MSRSQSKAEQSLVAGRGVGKAKFMEQVRTFMRTRRYSLRTEQAYLDWIRRFILFHGKRHPRELNEKHVSEFLSSLARNGRVAGGRRTLNVQLRRSSPAGAQRRMRNYAGAPPRAPGRG